MKLLLILYVAFVCYVPVFGRLTPRLYGDIRLEWLIFYALLIYFFVRESISKNLRLGGPLVIIVFLYSCIVLMSVSWSANYTYDTHTLTRIFARVISPLMILFLSMNIFREEETPHFYIKHLLWASFFISLINIYQMLSGGSYGSDDFRASGNFNNPNGVAMFLVLTLPCLLYAFERKLISKKLGLLFTVIVASGVISTVSRKGIFSMLLVYFIYFLYKKHFKKLIVSFALAVIIAIGLSNYAAISHRFSGERIQNQFAGKSAMEKAGIRMFLDHPVIGLGYRGYYENFGRYFPHAALRKYSAHNIYITALANYGMIGFALFSAIFIVPLVACVKILFLKQGKFANQYSKDMALVCVLTLIPFMLCGFYAGGLFYNYNVLYVLYSNTALFLSISSSHGIVEA